MNSTGPNPEDIPRSLDRLVQWLDQRGEMQRIEACVDPVLEIAALTQVLSRRGGQALWFTRVKGSRLPVVTNLFGTRQRAAWAWGCFDTRDLGKSLAIRLAQGPGQVRAVSRLRQLLESGPTVEVSKPLKMPAVKVDLGGLPALQSWPGDGGRFLTLPLVSMRDPATGVVNWGIYRMQVLGPRTTAIHFLPGSQGSRLVEDCTRRGQALPLAVTLGGDPALLAAATLPLPRDVDEAAFVALVTGRSPLLAVSPQQGLPVAAHAEIVLEGEIRPGDLAMEGPFGNHTGYYRPPAPAPVFHVTGLYHGEQPFFPATMVGPPPLESTWLRRAGEPLMLALLQAEHPCITQLRFFDQGAFQGCVLLGLEGGGELAPLDLARLLWREGPLRGTRLLVFVDAQHGEASGGELLWRIFNHCLPERDLLIAEGRLAVDATRKHDWPEVALDSETLRQIEARWLEYGLTEQDRPGRLR